MVQHAAVLSPTATVSFAVEDGAELVLAVADAHPFKPKPGDYLIVNQRRFLHGREALHSGQETVPVADRRLLLQLFLRAMAGDGSAA